MATGPIIVLTLLTTEEIQQALALTERGGVLPNGEVCCPEAFRLATPAEWEVLERWTKLCGEPLDHLGLAEELVDRIGEAERERKAEGTGRQSAGRPPQVPYPAQATPKPSRPST